MFGILSVQEHSV